MKVWVIMGNDFPSAVRLTKRAADRYVERKKEEGRNPMYCQRYSHRIYWRHYEFKVTLKGKNLKK